MTNRNYLMHDEVALRNAAQLAIEHATRSGADAASASAQAGGGIKVVVRDGIAETAIRDGFQSLDVTVFCSGRHASASTAALDAPSLRQAVEEAVAIAKRVDPDDDAGLADPDTLAMEGQLPELFAPSGLDVSDLLVMALSIEAEVNARAPSGADTLRLTEAGAASNDMIVALATSEGFCRSVPSSHHGRWAMVMAQQDDGAVQDFHESQDRRIERLDVPSTIAASAIGRASARLGGRSIGSRRAPVLFDARIAPTIVHDIVGALSGGSQYRRASFLLDSLEQPIAADHVVLDEDPFEPFGLSSGGYDAEGVSGTCRRVVDAGVAKGYFLATLSARRLGRRSTGNANGPYNLHFSSKNPGGDVAAMRAQLGTGLVVTKLLGGITDPVQGGWTRAVAGVWVENGEIVHPVQDITLAGTMTEMLQGIVAIGSDVLRTGAVRTGSILVDSMTIGGRA